METLTIEGGRALRGEVAVAGSKNGALGLLAAVVLSSEPIVLENAPDIADVNAKLRLLTRFGVVCENENGVIRLDPSGVTDGNPEEETVRSIRTSFFLLGPLLARNGKVRIAAPGGCKIGARPVDFHIRGLRAMGAEIDFDHGVYTAKADRLKGATIYLDSPSPGATNHLMSTATLADGITVIQNAAMEPEVVALAGMLNCMGARVEGAGTSTIMVTGKPQLGGCRYRVPADRMQAGTYLVAAAATRGDVTVRGVLPEDQIPIVNKLRETGASVEEGGDWIRVRASERPKAVRVRTMPHPGFPTDMQQPMCALLTEGLGTSEIEETIYENRIGHIDELNRMGADIRLSGKTAIVAGVNNLRGAVVEATDLRCGAALVVAGLAADGLTQIKNVHHIDRGYERFEDNLRSLGAEIRREAPAEAAVLR